MAILCVCENLVRYTYSSIFRWEPRRSPSSLEGIYRDKCDYGIETSCFLAFPLSSYWIRHWLWLRMSEGNACWIILWFFQAVYMRVGWLFWLLAAKTCNVLGGELRNDVATVWTRQGISLTSSIYFETWFNVCRSFKAWVDLTFPPLAFFVTYAQLVPRINLWCDTRWTIIGQHGSWATFTHLRFQELVGVTLVP